MCQCDIDVTLEAPLIVLPCDAHSLEVLVVELGRMTMSNERNMEWAGDRPATAVDSLIIHVR